MTALQATARSLAADERRVLHAHLRPATPDGAWAMRWALEDAIRCASFDDFGRLVLVRRLRIGALPPRCVSSQMAAAIERAWREAARTAVPALAAGDPGVAREAVDAAAVWFTSPAAATLAALARVIDGVSLAGWFWTRAVPVLAMPGGRDERIVALADELMAAAPATAAQAFPNWPPARLDTLRSVLETQAPGRREALRVAPARAEPPTTPTAAASPGRNDAPQDWRAQVGPRPVDGAPLRKPPHASLPPEAPLPIGRGSAPDSRRRLAVPISARPPSAPRVGVDASSAQRPARVASDCAAPAVVGQSEAAADLPSMGARPDGSPVASVAPGLDRVPASESAAQPSFARTAGAAALRGRPSARRLWPWLNDARLTAHGGILWLLNLLPALGFGPGAPAALVQAVLTSLMDRAGLPADDPQREALPLVPDEALRSAVAPEARRWQARVRRVLRRRAGLSLAELARHPAWVTVTPTHADLVLPMTATDLRVRRLGLDRDPGWVPWVGRIVSFHFVAPEDWPEPESPDE